MEILTGPYDFAARSFARVSFSWMLLITGISSIGPSSGASVAIENSNSKRSISRFVKVILGMLVLTVCFVFYPIDGI